MNIYKNPPEPVYIDSNAEAPKFAVGQTVRIKSGSAPGHIRTPVYLRNKIGFIERICGHFGAPERLAYRHRDTSIPLYRVRVMMSDIWEETENPADTLDVEIFEHWLEEA